MTPPMSHGIPPSQLCNLLLYLYVFCMTFMRMKYLCICVRAIGEFCMTCIDLTRR